MATGSEYPSLLGVLEEMVVTECCGKIIDTYCRTHDAVCCSVCDSLDHIKCADKHHIPTIARGTSCSKELQDTNKVTKAIQQKLDSLQDMKKKNLEAIRSAKDDSLARTKRHKEKLIKYIEDLEETTTAEIVDQYSKLESAVRDDLDEISKQCAALEQVQDHFQRSMNNESKLFVHLKQCKEVLTASEKLTRDSKTDIVIPTYEIDNSIERFVKDRTTLCRFVDNAKEYNSAEYMSDENIRSPDDTSICNITGLCHLHGGGLMIADHQNQCLKKLDQNFQIKSRLTLPSSPWAVCQTSLTEVAVSMWKSKMIQFVTVRDCLSLTRSFSTSGNGSCTGIAYRVDRLYVGKSRPECTVQGYSISGTLLQTIQSYQAGTPIFSFPAHIALSTGSSNINIAGLANGLATFDTSGWLMIWARGLYAFGVCALPGDQLLVCGRELQNVIQVDAEGKEIRTLLTSADRLNRPQTLHFDARLCRLVIGMLNNDKIQVYRLVRK